VICEKNGKLEEKEMQKRIDKIIMVLILMGVISLSGKPCLAGWPISYIPPVEGRVVDAVSGEPIENVIVTADWTKDMWTGLIDTVSGTIILTPSNVRQCNMRDIRGNIT
jgi:hypothetical protein